MNLPFILVMTGLGSFITLLIWLDYRRLGRIKPDSAMLAGQPLARWSVSGEEIVAAQRTERLGRLERVEFLFLRNLKVIFWFDVGIAVLFTGLMLISLFARGVEVVDAKYVFDFLKVLGAILGAFSLLILAVTGVLMFDVIGFRTLKTFFGLWDRRACTVSIFRSGILYEPGGFQRFNYRVVLVRVLSGETFAIQIKTAAGKRAQDVYVPVPKGREGEAEDVAAALNR